MEAHHRKGSSITGRAALGGLRVLRDHVDPDALDDSIDLMSPPGSLGVTGRTWLRA